MQKSNSPYQLKENTLFFPLIRLITNSSAALTTIHKKHGALVLTRFFGKLILFVAKPEHIEHIFSQEAKGNVSRDALYEAKKPVFGNGLANSKNDLWANQRKLMQPFFNKEAIACWNDLMVEETAAMVNRFKATEMSEINISKEIKLVVQSIVTRILFGDQLNNTKQNVLMDCVDTIIKGLVPQLSSGVLGSNIFNYLFIWQNRRFNKAVKQFADFVEHALKANTSKNDNSLLSLLSHATDKKTGYAMTEALLKDEAITLYLAGQDTTINTVVWFFYLLGKHEAVQQKIIEEILCYKDEPLTPENMAKLTYTKATLQETLRRYPAATAVSRNPIVDDFLLAGNDIPRNTTMLISIYAAHHDAQSWEKPDDYPEHFSNPELAGKRHRHAYLPFGGGIHNCIGKHLAEQEMMIIIVSLLRAFAFKTEMTVKTAISVTMKPDRDVLVSVKPLS